MFLHIFMIRKKINLFIFCYEIERNKKKKKKWMEKSWKLHVWNVIVDGMREKKTKKKNDKTMGNIVEWVTKERECIQIVIQTNYRSFDKWDMRCGRYFDDPFCDRNWMNLLMMMVKKKNDNSKEKMILKWMIMWNDSSGRHCWRMLLLEGWRF